MKTVLFLFLLGSEVRQFVYSGIITGLQTDGIHVVIAARYPDDDLRAQLPEGVLLVQLPLAQPSFWLSQLRATLDQANARRETRQGRQHWTYGPSIQKHWRGQLLKAAQERFASILSRSPKLYHWAQRLEAAGLRRLSSSTWDELFDTAEPALIVLNVPKVVNVEIGLAKARARQIKTALFYHTWKDVTVASGRMNHDFDLLGVWNRWMSARLLTQNPQVVPERVQIVGCTHFDAVGDHAPSISRETLYQSLGIALDSPFILFTASSPKVVAHEALYVGVLVDAIARGDLPAELRIVVRANPMDREGVFSQEVRTCYPEVIVTVPDWRWQSEVNWCFQRYSDQEFYNALLRDATVNVSVPSTVSVECAVVGLPVVNIGFDLPGVTTHQTAIRAFWDAEFYSLIRDHHAAILAETSSALIQALQRLLIERDQLSSAQHEFLAAQLGVMPGHAKQVHLDLIRQIVDQPHLGAESLTSIKE